MPRYKLTIEYDGPLCWLSQDGPPTVQGVLEAAVLAFSGETGHAESRRTHRHRRARHRPGVHLDLEKDGRQTRCAMR
jgi:tRNA pseudouridine38-40 synthase